MNRSCGLATVWVDQCERFYENGKKIGIPVIKYLFVESKTPTLIKDELDAVD